MSMTVSNTTKVIYRVVVTKKGIKGSDSILYGLEGADGACKTVIPALSYDRSRIQMLVDNMNEAQFDLQKLNELVCCNITNEK